MRRCVRVVTMLGCVVTLLALAPTGAGAADTATVPDPRLTPGAVDARTATGPPGAACPTTAPATRVSDALQQKVFTAYHVADDRRAAYVIDRLVPARLGGSAARTNLWPLRRSRVQEKRAMERAVTELVCSGALDLTTAQDLVRHDWEHAAALARQAAEDRKASVGAYLAAVEQAEQQRLVAEYLASLPPPTTQPRRVIQHTGPGSLPPTVTNPCLAFSIPRDPNNPTASPPTCPLP